MARALIPLHGQTFGRLTVVSRLPNKGTRPVWLCRCQCGIEKPVLGDGLRSGSTRSCGCFTAERRAKWRPPNATHGLSKTPVYRSWMSMRTRCYKPTVDNYKNYGAKGIEVCERWRASFVDFLADMGPRPSLDHTLDRINSKGNYEPGNVRWATSREQNNNRSSNRIVDYRGESMTLANALRKAGNIVRKNTAQARLEKGWAVEAAVETRTS